MLKKIIVSFLVFISFGNAYAATQTEMLEEQTRGMDSAADIVAEQDKAFDDSTTISSANQSTSVTTDGSVSSGYSPCRYSEGASLGAFLNGCKPKTVVGGSDMTVEGGFKSKINKWIVNLSVFLGVMAVGSLVYAAFLMQISGGADEDIKKGKNIVKNTILGFLALIMASGIVYLVINVMFGLGS